MCYSIYSISLSLYYIADKGSTIEHCSTTKDGSTIKDGSISIRIDCSVDLIYY